MIRLLAIPLGNMSSYAAMLLVVSPGLKCVSGGLVRVEVEVAILLVIGPELTGAHYRKPPVCRVPGVLPSAKFQALGKQSLCQV